MAAAPGKTMLGRNLSAQARVPSTYLSKIMLSLRRGGIVAATRGSGGGYRLAKPADSVSLMEIIELFDGDRARPGCILGQGDKCSDHRGCAAHNLWKDVKTRYVGFLENTTLADIAAKPHRRR